MRSIIDLFKQVNEKVTFKNHEGRFKVPSGYDSWLDYWEQQKGREALKCSNLGCGKSPKVLVGGHVDVYGESGIFLTPLCKECNLHTNKNWMQTFRINLLRVPEELLIPTEY
ncbi:MAG: hypothetical protein IJ635_00680 [Bacteroidaceae bacterium]|nr:hypothetical protein [Bacteroidaceae bacterium]